jgi:hypothetical protein
VRWEKAQFNFIYIYINNRRPQADDVDDYDEENDDDDDDDDDKSILNFKLLAQCL